MSAGPTTRVADFGSRTMWNDGQINCFTTLFQQDRVLISRPCYCASCPTRPDYGITGKRSLVRELPKKGTCGSSVPCGGSGGAVGWDSSALETRPMFVHAGCAASALCAAKRCLPRRRHEGPIVPSHCRSFLCLRQSNFARRRRNAPNRPKTASFRV